MDEVPQIVQKAAPKVTTVIQEPVVAQPKVAPYQMPQVSNDIVEFPNGKILKMSRVEAQKRERKGKLKNIIDGEREKGKGEKRYRGSYYP